jgi:3-oxoacyl-[acyl-carrier protein] reductase
MARELATRNITVNAVAPGFIETEMTANLNEKQRESLLKNIPLGRLGKPEDIARVVAFLCSEDADYITGQVISVDGGMVM